MDERSVLFVCTGNTCRSPMAEAILNHLSRDGGTSACSAGLAAAEGQEASIGAQDAMARMGIDLSAHRARPLTRGYAQSADLILCMTRSQETRVKELFPELADRVSTVMAAALGQARDIADPFGGDEAIYDDTADTLYKAISALIEKNFD